ncbi:MAG TPA: UDP-N-acetylmuramoyl-tripeptide--D-alanyl-D-alanine ligase [Verrucomicrobiales bacterium]|nr:UDP-N-acetylmuramoyl-tripeptide--D-alanyl-D-alanine ligase [Verrucomicrobiales bacterium]
MEERTVSYISEACSGKVLYGLGSEAVKGIATDSRSVQTGDLFIAIKGPKFDAHDFVDQAREKGAACLMVDTLEVGKELSGIPLIQVRETRAALGELAMCYRRDFDIPIIAVVGSNGKTTTKDLIAALLGGKFSVTSSPESFNNDIGVPLSLLQLRSSHEVVVMEIGSNKPGELKPLVEMIHPQWGVLTNIGREHLEFFKDLKGVAEEEGGLAELLPGDGKFFVPGDDEWACRIADRTEAEVIKVGLHSGNDWIISDIKNYPEGGSFHLQGPFPVFVGEYCIGLLGEHQAQNAALGIAVGAEMGMTPMEIREGLTSFRGPRMRMEREIINGVVFLNDSYNANADSVSAALKTLGNYPCKGRRVAVLGDMAELGDSTNSAHREAGRLTAELGIDRIVTVGQMAGIMGDAARSAGLTDVEEFSSAEKAGHAVCQAMWSW